jgi:hypothetical protein
MLRLMGWHHDRAYIIIHRPGGKAEQYLRKHLFPFRTKYNPVPPSSNVNMIGAWQRKWQQQTLYSLAKSALAVLDY